MKTRLLALVLAAGQSTRFKSKKNKVLHPLLGRPMLRYVLDAVLAVKPEKVFIVVGFQKDELIRAFSGDRIGFIVQDKQLGSAHAVLSARRALRSVPAGDVLIIHGDLPLISASTLRGLVGRHRRNRNSLTLLSSVPADPSGFGRIVREGSRVRVVEESEASPSQMKMREVNTGVYVFNIKDLLRALPKISNRNRKKEYYFTDMAEILSERKKVEVFKARNSEEAVGVNTRSELARAAEGLRGNKVRSLSDLGVTVLDPRTVWIDLDVRIGADTVLYPSVTLEGNSRIGSGCVLHPFVHIVNSRIGNNVTILGSCLIRDCVIGDGVQVGPFAHLRAQSVLRPGSKVGNFVEMKNTSFGKGSKAMHLSYLGDSTVEEGVNIGAGTITCNYDGVKKNRTHIQAGVFIGSGTELIAPVTIGRGAYVAAGSTITKNVSPGALAVARARQSEKPGWAKRRRPRKK